MAMAKPQVHILREHLWHWKEDTRHKEGMKRPTASTIRLPIPWKCTLYDTDSWHLGKTFGAVQLVHLRPTGSRLDGVPVVLLHCHLSQLLGLSLAQWIL